MQHGAVLGGVDFVTHEHPVTPALHVHGPGQLQQELHRVSRDPMLGVVEQQIAEAKRETAEAFGILRKQLTQVPLAHGCGVRLEHLPSR